MLSVLLSTTDQMRSTPRKTPTKGAYLTKLTPNLFCTGFRYANLSYRPVRGASRTVLTSGDSFDPPILRIKGVTKTGETGNAFEGRLVV